MKLNQEQIKKFEIDHQENGSFNATQEVASTIANDISELFKSLLIILQKNQKNG